MKLIEIEPLNQSDRTNLHFNSYLHPMKFGYLLLLFLFVACSLNADQEATLNKAVNVYITSRNEGSVISYVAMVHPNAVSYFKSKGDEAFLSKFDLSSDNEVLQDGTIMDVEKDAGNIHVLYEFYRVDFDDLDNNVDKVTIVAVSEDKGKSWFFIEYKDYMDTKIIPAKQQLLKD